MKHDIFLPQVELNMESVEVVRWLISIGDRVQADQPILEVETQKSVIEVPSPVTGYVRILHAKSGDEINEKSIIATLSDEIDEVLVGSETLNEKSKSPSMPQANRPMSSANELVRDEKGTVERHPVRATPLARKVASDLGVSLRQVAGTGPGGRIRHTDVRSHFSLASKSAKNLNLLENVPGSESTTGNDRSADLIGSHYQCSSWTPLSPSRRSLIEQMQRALSKIPQINITRQLDVTPLMKKTVGFTFTHRLIVVLARALKIHPALRTVTDGVRVMTTPVSIAVAMETPHGLVAPVIRAADSLSLEQIVPIFELLRAKALDGALKRSDLVDGPFALTNLGKFEVDHFDPLIFDGQTAVIAVGRAAEAIGGRKIAWFTLAVDHRVVDGAEAARFLMTLQEEINRS